MEIWRRLAQYLMMVSYHDLSVLEALGYDVEVAAADVCEDDEVGVNGADLFESLLAEIFHDSQMNNRIETLYRFKGYCTSGQTIGVEMRYCQNR